MSLDVEIEYFAKEERSMEAEVKVVTKKGREGDIFWDFFRLSCRSQYAGKWWFGTRGWFRGWMTTSLEKKAKIDESFITATHVVMQKVKGSLLSIPSCDVAPHGRLLGNVIPWKQYNIIHTYQQELCGVCHAKKAIDMRNRTGITQKKNTEQVTKSTEGRYTLREGNLCVCTWMNELE